jgi:hypothetical protein
VAAKVNPCSLVDLSSGLECGGTTVGQPLVDMGQDINCACDFGAMGSGLGPQCFRARNTPPLATSPPRKTMVFILAHPSDFIVCARSDPEMI